MRFFILIIVFISTILVVGVLKKKFISETWGKRLIGLILLLTLIILVIPFAVPEKDLMSVMLYAALFSLVNYSSKFNNYFIKLKTRSKKDKNSV